MVGDFVVGTGGKKSKMQGHLAYWMRVGEILTFDQYWEDMRFRKKRPFMRGSYIDRYGDNIYHRNTESGSFIQEDSFHSEPGGQLSVENLERDTGSTDRVLIASGFAYWGGAGPKVPDNLGDFVVQRQGHKCRYAENRRDTFLAWLNDIPDRGFINEPALWRNM